MHVFKVSLSGVCQVGFYKNMVGGGQSFEAVFTSPKQCVAMAVCSMLNGSSADLLDQVNNVNNFLTVERAKHFNQKTFI